MKKVLLVMCFLGAANLFADGCANFCSSVVFQKNSAYIRPDAVPVLKALCQYAVFEQDCNSIEFKDNGTAWVQESKLEDFRTHCETVLKEANIQEDNEVSFDEASFWDQFFQAAASVKWRH